MISQAACCYGVLTLLISVDHCAADPESVARGPRSVCPRGPVVPAWLGVGVPGSRIGGSGAPFGVPAWSRGPVGPVVPSGLSLFSSLFAVWGPRSGIIEKERERESTVQYMGYSPTTFLP